MIVPNRDKERRELEIKRLNEQTEILVKHASKFIADRYIEKERVREAIKKFESYACETSCSIGYTIAEELLKELGLEVKNGKQ